MAKRNGEEGRRRREEKRRRIESKKGEQVRMDFWNVTGVRGKDENFWEWIK